MGDGRIFQVPSMEEFQVPSMEEFQVPSMQELQVSSNLLSTEDPQVLSQRPTLVTSLTTMRTAMRTFLVMTSRADLARIVAKGPGVT